MKYYLHYAFSLSFAPQRNLGLLAFLFICIHDWIRDDVFIVILEIYAHPFWVEIRVH
jgi:hypothetical protein